MKTSFFWTAAIVLSFAFCGQTPQTPSAAKQDGHSPEAVELRKKTNFFLEEELFDSALTYARRGAEVSEKANDWTEWGKANINILVALYNLNQSAEAASTFTSIEQTGQAHIHADSSFWGEFFNCEGVISEELGNYEEALRYGEREIGFYEKRRDDTSLAVAYNNVGRYYLSRGDFDRALEYAQSALQKQVSAPPSGLADVAWTYGNLSKIWYRKKDFRQALGAAREALAILEKNFPGEKPEDFIIVYNDLANVFIETGRSDTALHYLNKALRLFEQGCDDEVEITFQNLGYAYRMEGKYPEAADYLKRAIEHYRPNHHGLSKIYRHLGFIDDKQGDYRGALAWQQQALRVLTDSFPYQDVLANPTPQRVNSFLDFLLALRDKGGTLRKLAEKESNQQFLEASLATFDIAAGVLDSMRAEYQEGSREFWNREARPIMESAIEVAFELHQKTNDPRYLEQAFRYAEKSKAQLLAEALRESAAKQQAGIPPELLENEKELKINIAFYKSQIFAEQQKGGAADAAKTLLWRNEILRQRRAYEALLGSFKSSYPEYFKVKYRDHTPKIDSLQQSLLPKGGLLEYFRGDQAIYAFYFDGAKFSGFQIALDSNNFIRPFARLLEGLRDRSLVREKGRSAESIAQFASDASALYRTLVAPAGKMPEKLIVIPDGDLAYLPFELLLIENPGANPSYAELHYLLQETTLRYEYSAGVALQIQTPQRPKSYFAGYAPSYLNDRPSTKMRSDTANCRKAEASDFGKLSNNEAEVKQIAALLKGKAFTGPDAIKDQFKQHAPEPRILHLAMHCFLNECDPLYSGLVFTQLSASRDSAAEQRDDFLYAYEIYNLKLHAELAVLSACNTGNGQLAKSEGVMSLARAFKYAGCPNVLMSLWQADDKATARIMEDFYKHLKKGLGKDAALRQAKLDYLKANDLNHPFFWGAFVLIGDDKPVTRSFSRELYAVAGLLAAALIGAGFYFWKRKKTI